MKILYAAEEGGGSAAAAATEAPAPQEPPASPTPDQASPGRDEGKPAKASPEPPYDGPKAEKKTLDTSRPEWLPEKFKDPSELAISYKELEGKMRTRTDDLKRALSDEVRAEMLKDRPESPDKYQLTLPEGALPEGLEFKPDANDPLYKAFREVAFAHGIPQKTFSTLVSAYVESIGRMIPDRASEVSKLGENGQERLDAALLWVNANVPKAQRDWLTSVSDRAEAIEFIEWAKGLAGDPRQGDRSTSASPPGPPPTAEELRAMQGDPRYWDPRKRDLAFCAKIDEGYRRLAASQKRRA
jgi:hypothetical protein